MRPLKRLVLGRKNALFYPDAEWNAGGRSFHEPHSYLQFVRRQSGRQKNAGGLVGAETGSLNALELQGNK